MILLRSFEVTDYPMIYSLYVETQKLHQGTHPSVICDPVSEGEFTDYMQSQFRNEEAYNTIVAHDHGTPVGYICFKTIAKPASIYQKKHRFNFIDQVAVSKAYRLRGVASLLIGGVKASSQAADIKRIGADIWLLNTPSLHCFMKQGFSVQQNIVWFDQR